MHESTTAQETKSKAVWPGAFAIYKESKEAIKNNLSLILGLLITYIIVTALFSVLLTNPDKPFDVTDTGNNIYDVVGLILGSIATIVGIQLVMRSIEGKKLDLASAFEKVTIAMFFKMVIVSILTALLLLASLVALVVPFFFVLPRLALATYFLVEKDTGITEAIKLSWEKTKGHSMKVWGVIGACIVMSLPALTIIGIPVALYFLFMYAAAYGLLYRYVTGKKPVAKIYTEAEPAYPKN